MTHTPVFLSLRSSGLRRGAALAILPMLLASCGSSTSTASSTPAPSNTTVASSPSASSATGSASSSAAKKATAPCLEPDETAKAETLKQQEAISADRGTALPSYVSARHVVRNQANSPPPAPKLNQREPSAWHCTRRTRLITPTPQRGCALSMTITWQAER